jgi:trehalose 6-phosphate phosphatase
LPGGAGDPDGAAPLAPALRPLAADPAHGGLILDFDGTLSAVVADPRDARPLPGVPDLLGRLASRFALVAVVSGRPTAFLTGVLGEPAGVEFAGLYGLERALHGAEHDAWARVIDAVVDEARETAPAGVYVEPKGLTVTLHWRNAPEHRDWVLDFAERQHAERGLLVHQGRAERELRPPLGVDKGTVVRTLTSEHDARSGAGALRHVAAFGDDMGDLPVFAALGELRSPDGAPLDVVRVAAVDAESPPEVGAAADLTVAGAAGAVALLEVLAGPAEAAQR